MRRRYGTIGLATLLCLVILWVAAGWAAANPAVEVEAPAGEAAQLAPEPAAARLPLDTPYQSFSMTLPCAADTFVSEASTGTNFGWNEQLTVGDNGTEKRALFRFDLSSLPAGSQIVSGTLRLNPVFVLGGSLTIVPEIILESWTEFGTTWDNRPSAAQVGDPAVQFDPILVNEIDVSHILLNMHIFGEHGIQLRPQSGSTVVRQFQARTTDTPPELVVYYTMKESFAPTQDTWVDETDEYVNYGSFTEMRVSRNAAGEEGYALIDFDVSSLPEDIVVTQATLRMYSIINREAGSREVLADELMVDAIVSDWDESTVTWHYRPPSQYMGDPPTTYAGSWGVWTEFDVAGILQSWADGLAEPNGILVRMADGIPPWAYSFQTRTTAHPPELIVEYSQAVPVCHPITGVTVDGATEGVTNQNYNFVAQTSPPDADPYDSITWVATDQLSPDYGTIAQMIWDTPGVKYITVTVEHCGGTTVGYHTITIQEPAPSCPYPITFLAIDGPVIAADDEQNRFVATASPTNVTTPITFTYEATDQTGGVTVSGNYTHELLYTWDSPGYKTITMTAESCNGLQVAYHTVQVLEPAQLPDLVVNDVWYDPEDNKVRFVLMNQGQTTVPAGHLTALYMDGAEVSVRTINDLMAPNAVRTNYFTYNWTCPDDNRTIEVAADIWGLVAEVSEVNNHWTDVWPCDQEYPTFVQQPETTDTSETDVDLHWQTSEVTECRVDYSTQAYYAPTEVDVPGQSISHDFNLKGLTADTTYHGRVYCEDPAGNGVNSEDFLFRTEPLNTDPPQFSDLRLISYPDSYYNFYEIRAILPAAELEGTSHVKFYINGVPVGYDYWPEMPSGRDPYYSVYISPYALGFSWDDFFGPNTYTAVGVSASGRESSITEAINPGEPERRVDLEILYPSEYAAMYFDTVPVPAGTTVNVQVKAAEFEWGCMWNGFTDNVPLGLEPVFCADVEREVNQLTLYLDGTEVDSVTPAVGQTLIEVPTPFDGLEASPHTLRAVADTDFILDTEISQDFFLADGNHSIDVQRAVVREDHYWRVTLTVSNNGQFNELIGAVDDSALGLQPVVHIDPAVSGAIAEWNWVDYYTNLNIYSVSKFMLGSGAPYGVELEPGESFSFDYLVVPILRHTEVDIGLGHLPVQVYVHNGSVFEPISFDRPATSVYDPDLGASISLKQAMLNAVGQADYLIVTNPQRVSNQYCNTKLDELSRLFGDMGKLAYLKRGVMGFVTEYENEVLDDLVEPGNPWAEAMHPDFKETDKGFLLIVGETEVIPSYYESADAFDLDDEYDDDGVHDTDLIYANTAGQTHRPELVLGRMLGDGAVELAEHLENVINSYLEVPGYGFDRSHAFIMSGSGNDNSTFYHAANHAYGVWWPQTDDLPYRIHAREWTSSTLLWQEIKPNLADRDMIFWFGHGNVDSFTPFSTARVDHASFSLGNSTPVIMAASCLTGNYEGSANDHGIAEAFLNKGAGVYIGSTEVSFSRANNAAFRRFSSYWNEWESAGVVLNHVKRAIWGKDGWYEPFSYWAFEYNLYGDPKHGMLEDVWTPLGSRAVQGADSVEELNGTTKLSVTVPKPVISRVETGHVAEIPGGMTLVEFGAYEVPLWTVSVPYQPGTRVTGVNLASRGEPVAYSNLDLPVVDTSISTEPRSNQQTPAAVTGWYPQLDQIYEWSVEKQSDGSSVLEIVIYPFYYNSDNGDAVFYQKHNFMVETITTDVEITDLSMEKYVWERGDLVWANLVVENTGIVTNVVVQASIRHAATGKLVDGLPLMSLNSLDGVGVLDLYWDSDRTSWGHYNLMVELRDLQGNVLDTAVDDFQLGVVQGGVSALTASQTDYFGGESIQLSMTVVNSGTVRLDGVGVIEVLGTDALTTTYRITDTFSSLAPGGSVVVSGWLDTSRLDDQYEVIAHAYYYSQVSEAKQLVLTNKGRVYLPLVISD